jgi:hypothetical protein
MANLTLSKPVLGITLPTLSRCRRVATDLNLMVPDLFDQQNINMNTTTRAIYFPYCLQQRKDSAWIILNRNYKPVGSTTSDWVDYDAHPADTCVESISSVQAMKISYNSSPNNKGTIYLYDDGCVPTKSKKDMDAYLGRIAFLMKLKTVREKALKM